MKTLVIINPASRRVRVNNITNTVAAKLTGRHLEIETTSYCGHATTLAREAARNNYRVVIAVGGDGTVNEVLNGVVGTDTALGIIPAGTANDIAHHHGLPLDTKRCCDIIAAGNTRQVDVIGVNQWHYLTVGGIGLPCKTLVRAENLKLNSGFGRILARLSAGKLYLLALTGVFAQRGWQGETMSLQYNGSRYTDSTVSLLIGNQSKLGNQFTVLPGAVDDDGQFDVFTILDVGRPTATAETVLRTINGSHVGRADVRMLRTDRLHIETRNIVSFFGDGQIVDRGRTFDVHVVPRAVKLIVPASKEVS